MNDPNVKTKNIFYKVSIGLYQYCILILLIRNFKEEVANNVSEENMAQWWWRHTETISGKSLEPPVQRYSFTGLVWVATSSKERLQHRCFPVSFAKILKITFHRIPQVNCFKILKYFEKITQCNYFCVFLRRKKNSN